MPRRVPRLLLLGLFALAIILLGLAASNGIGPSAIVVEPRAQQAPPSRVQVTPMPVDAGADQEIGTETEPNNTRLLGWLALGVLAAVAAGLAWWLWRRLSRGLQPALAPESVAEPVEPMELDTEQVARELRRSLDELAASSDLHGTVVDCWRRLEELAAGSGAVREDWQTTSEYVVEVMGATPADPHDVQELAAIYRRACYSSHPPTAAEQAAAVGCLTRLAETLEGARGVRTT